MTSLQRAPPFTRYVRAALSGSIQPLSTVIAVPSLGIACPPIECRAAPTFTGRSSARAKASSARKASTRSSPWKVGRTWDRIGVAESSLASLRINALSPRVAVEGTPSSCESPGAQDRPATYPTDPVANRSAPRLVTLPILDNFCRTSVYRYKTECKCTRRTRKSMDSLTAVVGGCGYPPRAAETGPPIGRVSSPEIGGTEAARSKRSIVRIAELWCSEWLA